MYHKCDGDNSLVEVPLCQVCQVDNKTNKDRSGDYKGWEGREGRGNVEILFHIKEGRCDIFKYQWNCYFRKEKQLHPCVKIRSAVSGTF